MATAVPEGPGAEVTRWFKQVVGVSPATIARVQAVVQHGLEAGAGRNVVPIATPELLADYDLRVCVKQALLAEWDTLSAEERLLICRHPCALQIGDAVRLPSRVEGTVASRELTKRFSVLIGVRLADGTELPWEFYE